jgi:hypothetical protein
VERGARGGGAIGGYATRGEGRSSGRSRREKSGGGGVGGGQWLLYCPGDQIIKSHITRCCALLNQYAGATRGGVTFLTL